MAPDYGGGQELVIVAADDPWSFARTIRIEPLRRSSRTRPDDALATNREGRKLLVDELGIEPHRELRELEQAIPCQDSSLSIGVPSQPYR